MDEEREDNSSSSSPPLSSLSRFAQHPLGAWLVENLACFLLGTINYHWTFAQRKRLGVWGFFWRSVIGGVISTDGSIIIQHFLVNYVYRDIPFFVTHKNRIPTVELPKVLWDYTRTMFPAHCIGSMISAIEMVQLPRQTFNRGLNSRFRLFPFLFRLAFLRFWVDITFYLVHRLLHTKPLYNRLHKQHHEHINPTVWTNYHFTVLDLLLEGFVPIFVGAGLLFQLYLKTGNSWFFLNFRDIRLSFAYLLWYEIGSHSGKALPCVTVYPPFAPIYNYLYKLFSGNQGALDRNNVLHHERHHNLVYCNYGITPWLDWLVGTYTLELNKRAGTNRS
jgi:sterol desaturase/sphingolipid hydroxylase (fatty acid hydroxylase superfamily)